MPILHNSLAPATGKEDPVTRSLRFDANRSDSSLHRTFSSGSQTNWTFSVWYKRTETGASDYIFNAGYNWGGYSGGTNNNSNNQVTGIYITSDDKLRVYAYNGSVDSDVKTDMLFRDPSSFYHIFISWDSSQSSGSRYKIFVNGKEVSCTHTADSTNFINRSNTHGLGFYSGNVPSSSLGSRWPYLAGYLADCYFIDGTTLSTPVDNMIEATGHGSYMPKAFDMSSYSGNSFHIDAQVAHDADLLVSSIGRNDGDTTFVDAAAGHTISTEGDTEHSVAVGNPFTGDGRAIYFDGVNGSEIETGTTTDFNFGTGDFTIECWINPSQSASQYEGLIASNNYGGSGARWTVYQNYSNIQFWGYNGSGSYVTTTASSVLTVGQWHHIAVTRASGTLKIYVDGVEEQSSTSYSSYDFSDDTGLRIGYSYSSYNYKGYMYDVRVVNGTAITPPSAGPTSKLTAVTNTKLLLQPDKSDSSWDDESGNQTLTGSGNVATVSPTASTPYNAAAKSTAMYFDGNDTLTGPSDIAFGTGAFTIEFWYQHVSDINGGATGANADIVISKGRRHTSHQGWLLFTHNNGTDKVNWVGYKVNGSSGTNYSLDANSTGVSLAHDGDWHHIAVTRDGSGNMGLFIDGTRYADATGYGGVVDNSGYAVRLASAYNYSSGATGHYANCYLYDVRITKGEAKYDPTSSSVTKPSAPFELNPVYIGGDQSGNKNHFQPMNDITMHDVVLDTPTKNYATLNPVSDVVASGSNTFSEGNLTLNPSYAYNKAASTIAVSSGKWYAEVRYDSAGNQMAGIGRVDCLENTSNYIGQSSSAFGYVIYRSTGQMYHNGSTTSIFSSISSGDILQIALDLDSNTVWWGLNGTWVGTVGSSGGTSITAAEYYFVQTYRNPCTWNFGQDNTFAGQFTGTPNNAQFAYEIPTGFKSLNASNLDDPSVNPAENFGVALYNGNSNSNAITGLGFQSDVLWTKSISTSGSSPKLFDSLRGVTKRLDTESNGAETTQSSELSSFDSDGFTLGSGSGSNYAGRTYAAWNWKAHQSDARAQYTVRVEDAGGDAWDSSSSFYDYSTYLPNVYMEILENRNGTLASLGKVAVRSLDPDGNSMSNTSQQDYTLKCTDLDAIAVKWYYDTSGDGQSYDFPCSYNDLLNEQKITIQGGNWTTNNHSNDDGCTDYDYSAPTGWGNGDSLKTATTSYNGTDIATLHASWESAPTEKYNAGAGFTIISYSGDSASDGDTQTINHSLGVPLEFVLAKNRTNSNGNTNGAWIVWHKDLPSSKFLKLNSNATTRTSSYGDLISTAVSGSQHQVVVANDNDNNSGTSHWLNDGGYGSAEDYILYGWATTAGMCKVGSYEGNGSSDGPFLAMDFAPAFFLYTNIDSSEHWYITDNKRPSYNVSSRNAMFAGHSNKESTESRYQMDFLSNGVKIRATHAKTNANNNTYLYLAMAEMPFKYGNGK